MATIAVVGNGREYDQNFLLNSNCKTTTSQYKAVVMDPTDGADWTVKLIDTSAGALGAYHAVGILQSYQNSGSKVGSVRLHGVSKAIAGAAFTAGANLQIAEATAGANTGGNVIVYAMADTSAGAVLVTRRLIGYALQNATATGQVVSIMVNPHVVNQ